MNVFKVLVAPNSRTATDKPTVRESDVICMLLSWFGLKYSLIFSDEQTLKKTRGLHDVAVLDVDGSLIGGFDDLVNFTREHGFTPPLSINLPEPV